MDEPLDRECRYCGRKGRRGFVVVAGQIQCAAQAACLDRMLRGFGPSGTGMDRLTSR